MPNVSLTLLHSVPSETSSICFIYKETEAREKSSNLPQITQQVNAWAGTEILSASSTKPSRRWGVRANDRHPAQATVNTAAQFL